MRPSKATLITHPIRARILTALMGRRLTTQQIGDLLTDVPTPSLYRHVRILADAGIVAPVEEVRVNGALTKVFAVQPGQTRIRPEDVPEATGADHLRYFTTFQSTLAETFRAYLERAPLDPTNDPIECLAEALHLTPAEYEEFQRGLQAFLKSWRERAPSEARRRLVFAHVILPDRPDPPRS